MYYEDKHVSSSSSVAPTALEVTATVVYVRRNIEYFTDESEDGEELSGWRYVESKYAKDDYIKRLSEENEALKAELGFTSSAVYELMGLVLGD